MDVNWKDYYIHYLRDADGTPFGCVIMSPEGRFGYSLVNREKGDHFSYVMARRVAFGRLACIRDIPKILPYKIVKLIQIEKRKAYAWLDRNKLLEIGALTSVVCKDENGIVNDYLLASDVWAILHKEE